MFKKILFPVDGLESSKKIIDYIKDFAKKFNSEVVLVSSLDLSVISPGPLLFSLNSEQEDEILFTYQSILNEIKADLEKEDIKAESKLVKGHPGSLICSVAKSENCDLIIMGKRELSTVKSYLLGSVSNYVVHHAICPVFLIDITPTEIIKI